MKEIFLGVLITFFGISLQGQQTDTNPQLTQQDYLQKSKNQKTAAWILTGGGTAMAIGGLVLLTSQTSYFPSEEVGAVLLAAGGAAIATGIILFSASNRNKKKADEKLLTFNLKLERTDFIQHAITGKKNYPALAFNIRLK